MGHGLKGGSPYEKEESSKQSSPFLCKYKVIKGLAHVSSNTPGNEIGEVMAMSELRLKECQGLPESWVPRGLARQQAKSTKT